MSGREKLRRLGLAFAVAMAATIAYRSIQHWQLGHATVRHDCLSWHWLPFDARWLWPYLSMFALLGLPWFLLPKWRQVQYFAQALLTIGTVGWIIFLIYPTACARPTAEGQPWAYAVLIALDEPNNCLPCLHSAYAVLAAWVLWRDSVVFRGATARVALVLWLAVIGTSIIALRQHTDIDMLVGVVLGATGGLLYQTFSASRVT